MDKGGGQGGGRWLVILAIIGLIAAWWLVYQPLRPDSVMLPPAGGVTNRVPEALTNLAHKAHGLTNLLPTNVFMVPNPFGGSNRVDSRTGPAAGAPTNVAMRSPGVTNVSPPNPRLSSPNPFAPDFNGRRPPQNAFEVQLALDRLGISPGSLDGVTGSQTRAAIRAFQMREGLPQTGVVDTATASRLQLSPPIYTTYTVTGEDLARLRPLSDTWLGKSQQDKLEYESILELVAERGHAHPGYIRRLNPGFNWTDLTEGASVTIPCAPPPLVQGRAARVTIRLAEKTLQAFDPQGRLIAHFPCSIARHVEKRPLGALKVVTAAADPSYTFDPEIFPESAEARRLNRKLTIPPGPNNPVGVAWIGLDRPGYGIHGTPNPEAVGRTESHGCFRLANWNAQLLMKLVWAGMPVVVEP